METMLRAIRQPYSLTLLCLVVGLLAFSWLGEGILGGIMNAKFGDARFDSLEESLTRAIQLQSTSILQALCSSSITIRHLQKKMVSGALLRRHQLCFQTTSATQ